MIIKKFYYYSPEKLKLIPVFNFIPKLIALIIISSITLSIFFTFLAYNIFFGTDTKILSNQESIILSQYDKEIEHLKEKYVELFTEFKSLSEKTNDVRLAVNLTPVDMEDRNFGVGGAVFRDELNSSLIPHETDISQIYNYVSALEVNLNLEAGIYEEIKTKFKENENLFSCLPAIKPVSASIGDRYGMRFHPILKSRRMHHGLDFLCNTGEDVLAPGDGTVTYVGNRGGYGKVIRIKHGFGYETIYAHLHKYKVKKGQKVKRGEVIAISGNSGSLSTGPHLHYEVRHNGKTLNPSNFFFDETLLFETNRSRF